MPPFSLTDMLGRALPPIHIVDVGAMWLEGHPPPYAPLARSGAARITGFEAVPAECDKLNARAMKNHAFLPYFIGDGTERTFHTCNAPMTSSLYEPNTALLKRFQLLEELTRVVGTERVATRRLDDLPEVERIDYLKIDVQGAELDVLRGSERKLADTLVIHLEVEFVPMYKGQPLFGEVDAHLRARGFEFHSFLGLCGRAFKPLLNGSSRTEPIRQHLWSDVLYVRDFMRLRELSPPRLLRMAAILHEAYSSADLAALCLQHHDDLTGGQLWKYYMQRLVKGTPEAPPLD